MDNNLLIMLINYVMALAILLFILKIRRKSKRTIDAALQAFFNITNSWGLSAYEERILLGSPTEVTFAKWKSRKSANRLQRDTLERISYIVGIYIDLNILLPSTQAANEWMKKPNTAPLFQGRSALKQILTGNITDLANVRSYLNSQIL